MNDELLQWLHRAQHALATHQDDAAIDALCRALALEPDHAAAHALLAVALVRRRRVHAAMHEARAALALDPELPLAQHALAAALTGLRRLDEAAVVYARLVDAAEPFTPALIGYAQLKALQGRSAEAQPLLQRAVELDPEDPEPQAALAQWHLDRGDHGAAEAAARAALAIEAEHAGALVTMGFVLLQHGDVAQARQHAAAALYADPQDTAALQLLAATKARSSPWLGLWWRFNVLLSRLGEMRLMATLIGLYIGVRALEMLLEDLGAPVAAEAVAWAWLAFAVYTWIGPAWFARAVRADLETVRIDRRY